MNSRKLEEIDLGLDLAGSEGHDVNYVSRVRTQFLYAQHAALVAQTQFADAKAAALMTLVGLVALRGPLAISGSAADWFSRTYLACVAASILCAFLAVFPRYPGRGLRDRLWNSDRWSWPALAASKADPDAFSSFMQTSEVSQLVHSVSLSNAAVSRILLAKFRMLRLAFIFAIAILAMTGAHLAGLA